MPKERFGRLRWLYIVSVVVLAGVRVYYEIHPLRHWVRLLGWDFTRDYGIIHSPGRDKAVRVRIEEVGAQRSGNPYIWVTTYSIPSGYRLAADGFIDAEDYALTRCVPLRWATDDEIEITLSVGKRRGSHKLTRTVRL